MNIDALPSRLDLSFAEETIAAQGWSTLEAGENLLVSPTGEAGKVLVSGRSYHFLNQWLRPVYSRVDIESDLDIRLITIPLLKYAMSEVGTISLYHADEGAKCVTIFYRVLIPSEADKVDLLNGILTALYSADDIKKLIAHYHDNS